jgi:Tfp pilus assembly protein PilN
MDNHTVALFMRRLQASKMFTSVDLTDIRRTKQARSKGAPSQTEEELMNFSLKIVIAPLTKKQVEKG